jgi:archaellum component FlaC
MSDATTYKSNVAQTAAVAQKYGIDLSKDNINKVLGAGYEHSNMATIEGIVGDLKELKSAVYKSSVKPGPLGYLYRATDKLGITSPRARLAAMAHKLEVQNNRIDRQIRTQEEHLEAIDERLKKCKTKKREVERMYTGLKNMTGDMHAEVGKLNDAILQNAAQVNQASDPSVVSSAYEAKEQCREQYDKLRDDIREIGYLKKRAATKVVVCEQGTKYATMEKNMRRMARDKLEDVKNGIELQLGEIQALLSDPHGSMIGVFEQIGKTYAVSEEVSKTVSSLSDAVFKKMVDMGRDGLVFEPPNIDRLEERNQEMERAQDSASSRVERLAEQIINKDAA